MLEDFIVLDIEATGVDPKINEIIEIAAIRIKNFSIVDRFETLVKPREKLDHIIEKLTGITNEALAKAPFWEEVKDQVASFIGELPVGGHNINFDFEYLSEQSLKLSNPRLDSWELSTTILPKLPAYNLSFLAFYLNLPSLPEHRAMSDVLSTWELFKVLFSLAGKLPAKVKKELAGQLKKSDWVWKDLFSGEVKLPPLTLPPPQTIQRSLIDPSLLETDLTLPDKKKLLVELSPQESELFQALALAQKATVWGPVFFLWPDSYPEPKTALKEPVVVYPISQYLSDEDFERFLGQENLSDLETKLLVKTIIWKEGGNTDPDSLYLTREELYFWERWLGGARGVESRSYGEAFKKAQKSKLVFVTPLALRELLEEKRVPASAVLFIADPLALEEEAYRQERFLITAGLFEGFVSRRRELVGRLPQKSSALLDSLYKLLKNTSSSLTFLLASLGVVYDSFSPSGRTLEIMEHLWGSAEGSRTKELAGKIVSDIKLFDKEVKKVPLRGSLKVRRDEIVERGEEMTNFLLSLATVKDFSFWLKAREGRVFLEALPEEGQRFLVEESKKQFQRLIVATNTASNPLGQNYLEKLVGNFEATVTAPLEAPKIRLIVPPSSDLALPASPHYLNQLEKKLGEILTEKKRTIILFPSRTRLHDFIENFAEKAFSLGIPLATPETIGALHKWGDFLQTEGAVLATTVDFWFRLPKNTLDPNPFEDLSFERLTIISLPFEVPDDPRLFALAKRMGEGTDEFAEISLPRTVFRLRRLIYPALTNPNLREIILLDARARDKDYGRQIIDSLRGVEVRI